MDAEFRCTLPSFHEYRTKDDDIITQSLEEQVIGYDYRDKRQRWNRAQATGLNAPKINLTKNNFKQNLN